MKRDSENYLSTLKWIGGERNTERGLKRKELWLQLRYFNKHWIVPSSLWYFFVLTLITLWGALGLIWFMVGIQSITCGLYFELALMLKFVTARPKISSGPYKWGPHKWEGCDHLIQEIFVCDHCIYFGWSDGLKIWALWDFD